MNMNTLSARPPPHPATTPRHIQTTHHIQQQVACETATKTGMVMVFGEITTKAKVNYEEIVRKTCKGIGFTSEDVGLDADTCKVGY